MQALRDANGSYDVWRLLSLIAPLVTVVNLGIAGWLVVQIVDLRTDRFTSRDGLAVWREIAAIRECLATKVEAKDVPSSEVLRWLERHDREIRENKRKIED